MRLIFHRPWGNGHARFNESRSAPLKGIRPNAGAPPSAAESDLNELTDYITPPPKNVLVVAVRYSEAKKGMPMPYDLPAADEES